MSPEIARRFEQLAAFMRRSIGTSSGKHKAAIRAQVKALRLLKGI